VIEVVGVKKSYRPSLGQRAQRAVDDLTLKIAKGRTTGLVGANGAGKTTTIRLILGLVRPDVGKVLFDGKPLRTEDKRRLGYMPEVGRLPVALTPAEVLANALRVHAPAFAATRDARRKAVADKLDEIGLGDHRDKRIGRLSKGMGRRLAFGLATIHKPDVLILDEPTSGLDPLGRRDLLRRIEEAKAGSTTILLCTHELTQVAALCDTVHVLRQGKLVHTAGEGGDGGAGGDGGVAQTGYCIHVSGADPAALARLGEGRKLAPWTRCLPSGFATRLSFGTYGAAAEWMKALLAQGVVVLRFSEDGAPGDDDLLAHFDGGAP
jgi:ABC-2 type transport system ATP-binding protein